MEKDKEKEMSDIAVREESIRYNINKNKRRGAVVRVAKDFQSGLEVDIRFDKKAGEFYFIQNDTVYLCLQIDRLERKAREVLATLDKVVWTKCIAIYAHQTDHAWGGDIDVPSSRIEVATRFIGLQYARFYLGQHEHDYSIVQMSWEQHEREILNSKRKFRNYGHWRNHPAAVEKKTLVYPFTYGDTVYTLYDGAVWETLEKFESALVELGSRIAEIIQPERIMQIAKQGGIPLLEKPDA